MVTKYLRKFKQQVYTPEAPGYNIVLYKDKKTHELQIEKILDYEYDSRKGIHIYTTKTTKIRQIGSFESIYVVNSDQLSEYLENREQYWSVLAENYERLAQQARVKVQQTQEIRESHIEWFI